MLRHDIDELISFLDSLAKLDPVAMGKLVGYHVSCNDSLADHPTVQIGSEKKADVVGMLGILNGYGGTIEEGDKKGWGMISAVIEKDGRCTGFCRTVP